MFYLDSSVAVAAVTAEAATEIVLAWLGDNDFAISDWVVTESSAALSQKRRMGVLSEDEGLRARAEFDRQFSDASLPLAVSRMHFQRAAKFAERTEINLRAGDALHLAIAEGADATLVTLDRTQARAGALINVSTLLLT